MWSPRITKAPRGDVRVFGLWPHRPPRTPSRAAPGEPGDADRDRPLGALASTRFSPTGKASHRRLGSGAKTPPRTRRKPLELRHDLLLWFVPVRVSSIGACPLPTGLSNSEVGTHNYSPPRSAGGRGCNWFATHADQVSA